MQLLVDDLNFSIPPGSCVGIIGGNGAGARVRFQIMPFLFLLRDTAMTVKMKNYKGHVNTLYINLGKESTEAESRMPCPPE